MPGDLSGNAASIDSNIKKTFDLYRSLCYARSMKIGDLVRRHSGKRLGVVLQVKDGYVKVCWDGQTDGVWSPIKALEIVNEAW